MEDRSNGTHISGIIYALCIKLKIYKADDPEGGPAMTRLQLGNALEDAVIARYVASDKKRYVKIGEQECDNLFGTPDMLDIVEWAVHEMKLTWMSTRHAIDSKKLWKYWVQVMAYCYMLKTTIGYLHICFVNGDYSYIAPGGDPTYHVYRAEFSKAELEENWKMLTTNAGLARQEDHSVDAPKKKGEK